MNSLSLPSTSPQLGIYGGTTPQMRLEPYIEAQAEFLPQLYEQEAQRKYQEDQIRLAQQQREDERRDANRALAIEGTKTAISTAPTLIKYGKKVYDVLKPQLLGASATTTPATTGFSAISGEAIPGATASTGLASKALTIGGRATGTVGIGMGAGNLVAESNFGRWAGKQKIGGYRVSEQGGKVAGGALAGAGAGATYGATIGSVVPFAGTLAGALLGGAIGGISGAISASTKKCIIISAAYGVDTDEVNIAREYRDKHFTKEILRGYYVYSQPIVELMEKYPEVKEYYKINLAEPLIRYAKFKLGYTLEHPSPMDCAIARNYTNIWHDIGTVVKRFIRSTGEVV